MPNVFIRLWVNGVHLKDFSLYGVISLSYGGWYDSYYANFSPTFRSLKTVLNAGANTISIQINGPNFNNNMNYPDKSILVLAAMR